MCYLVCVLAIWSGMANATQAQTIYQFPEDDEAAAYVANEIIATFYHELGHALIDVLDLPLLGKEEDAADHLSVILMNDIWGEDVATQILTSNASTYSMMAARREEGGEEPLFADTHSLDLQRYYTAVCLFYGANPDVRSQLASDLGLPSERAEGCEWEWYRAAASWDAVLKDAVPGKGRFGLAMAPGQKGAPLVDLLAEEVAGINQKFGLPEQVTVEVTDCGEANAFYHSDRRVITLCNEYAQDLQEMWEAY